MFAELNLMSSERNAASTDDGVDIFDIVGLGWRYKYLIIAMALVLGLAAVYYALTATPIYRAEVVLADAPDRSMNGMGSLPGQLGGLASLAGLGGTLAGTTAREAQAFLISNRLAEEFVKRQELKKVLMPAKLKSPSLWFAVKRFREQVLSVNRDKLTGITTVGVEWRDPVVAARWANGFVTLANELIRERATRESTRNIAYLQNQLERTNVVEMQRVMYNLIETETKTLMLAAGRIEYAFTVVDPAVPAEMRVRPRRTLIVLSGLVAGGMLGFLCAYFHDAWHRRQRKI